MGKKIVLGKFLGWATVKQGLARGLGLRVKGFFGVVAAVAAMSGKARRPLIESGPV
jgi:hypothetical protein